MPYRDPKPEELIKPEFNAIWECIKHWDVGRPEDINIDGGQLYSGATGNHVVCILDALKDAGVELTNIQPADEACPFIKQDRPLIKRGGVIRNRH